MFGISRIKRFAKAVKDYYRSGQAGDLAFLKTELIGLGANPRLLAQLRDFVGHYPSIDLHQLHQLPPGTLGHEYAQHMLDNKIQPLEISSDLHEAADRKPFALRITVTHDIFHVLLGFDTSYAGEIGVFSFTVAQKYSRFLNAFQPIVNLIYPLALPTQRQAICSNARRGKALGKQADCLLTYSFEQDWARPLDDIRTELGLVLATES